MTEYVVKDIETNSLVSSYGSREWASSLASALNKAHQTGRYKCVPYERHA